MSACIYFNVQEKTTLNDLSIKYFSDPWYIFLIDLFFFINVIKPL